MLHFYLCVVFTYTQREVKFYTQTRVKRKETEIKMVKVRVRVFKSIARSSRARQCARISRLYLKTILLTELMTFVPNDAGDFPTR